MASFIQKGAGLAPPPFAALFEAHLQKASAIRWCTAVERGLRGACFVAFHFDESETLATARENVVRQVHGAHRPVGFKQPPQVGLGGLGREIANE